MILWYHRKEENRGHLTRRQGAFLMRKKRNPFKGSPKSLHKMMIQNINKLPVCRFICKRIHSDFLEQSRITLFLEVER